MGCIVYQENKKTGVVYAYWNESYRDPVTKKPTSKRTYMGRVDPITKEIVEKTEKGKRNRSQLNSLESQEKPAGKEDSIIELQTQLKNANETISTLRDYIKNVNMTLTKIENEITGIVKCSSNLF